MENFAGFGLPSALDAALKNMGYTTPTPIQVKAIPVALEGKDVLGSAQTGTGKTAAFGIPLVSYLLNNTANTALVLAPTRELAMQVADVLTQLAGKGGALKAALLIGGTDMRKQINDLRNRPRIIVGTPGRVIDHLERGTLFLGKSEFLVLDETDRMLDMGFGIQLEKILKFLPKKRQTLMFSATFPSNIKTLSAKYLVDPVRISAGEVSAPAANLTKDIVHTTVADKRDDLVKELEKRTGSIIVFVKTKFGADRLARTLSGLGHVAEAIHGDLSQSKRLNVLAAFRKEKFRILVATDVASRGLDIPHIEHVINYDLPQSPEDYIHRIGRTARAGAKGAAVCLLLPEDKRQWRLIARLLDPTAVQEPEFTANNNRKPSSSRPARRSGGGYPKADAGGAGAKRRRFFGGRKAS